MKRKKKELHIRITLDEWEMIEEKASKYKSKSQLIIDAVRSYNEDRVHNYNNSKLEIISNNIDELTKFINQTKNYADPPVVAIMEVGLELEEVKNLLRNAMKDTDQ